MSSSVWRYISRSWVGLRLSSKSAHVIGVFVLSALLTGVGSAQNWRTEVVDGGTRDDVGQFSSLAIDRDGNLHVAYWDASANSPWGELFYGFRGKRDTRWSRMEVDKDGIYVTLAVDSAGHPHFAYNSKLETGLHYAFWDGQKWHKEIVDPGHIDYFTCIQVDPAGHPKISYYLYHLPTGEYSLRLKYAFFDGKSWYIQTLDKRDHTGKYNSLALDVKGNAYVAYSYVGNGAGDLFYAHGDGLHWSFDAAEQTSTRNTYSLGGSIAVDSTGHPHIAYFDHRNRTVQYASWNGREWAREMVDRVVDVELLDNVSLKLDSKERPHIAYYDAGAGMLKYAVQEGRGWRTEVVDQSGNVGLRPSLALDSVDHPYISYYDLSDHLLRVAHRQIDGPDAISTSAKR